MGGGAKKQNSPAASGWKRTATASLLLNAVLLGVLFIPSMRGGGRGDIDGFLDTYFRTWSAADMRGYEACFHPSAVIFYISGDAVPRPVLLGPFIQGQAGVHANASEPLREIPLSKQIEIDGNVARALVRWKLFRGEEEKTGTDYFTLLRTKTGWRIINLVFRED